MSTAALPAWLEDGPREPPRLRVLRGIVNEVVTASAAEAEASAAQQDLPRPDIPRYAAPLYQPARYKVLYGGRGAARSWSVARTLLDLARQHTIRVLCTRELQSSIKDSVHRLLKDQIERLGYSFQVTDYEIRHANGSLFIFRGLRHHISEIKSIEGIDICWVEEAERVSKESWDVLIPTIRKSGSEIWITFNPDLETDPTYQRFVVDPPPNSFVKKATWKDNPWFPDELRAEKDYLYRVDPDAAEHVWGGNTRSATDAQILRGKWVIEDFEPQANWSGPYHGADWGFAQDPTAAVRCWVDGRTLYIEYESWKVGLELDDTAEKWERDIPGIARYVVRADSARPESISHVRRHGIPNIEGVEKWSGSIEDGIAHLRSYERIVIHPRCEHAKEEARLYSYKVDQRTGDVLPVVLDRHNHLIDSTRYALAPLIKQALARDLDPAAYPPLKG